MYSQVLYSDVAVYKKQLRSVFPGKVSDSAGDIKHKSEDDENQGFLTWMVSIIFLVVIVSLGYSSYNQRLFIASLYGVYELTWEFWQDLPTNHLRRKIIWGENSDVKKSESSKEEKEKSEQDKQSPFFA